MEIRNQYDRVSITSVKSITLVALFSALTVSGRLLLAFIPNVQPVTSLIILFTLLLGIRYGMVEAILVIVLSNLFLGFGIWTFGQILGYIVIVLLVGLLIRPNFKKIPFSVMILFAAAMGFLYGFIQALFQIPFFGWGYFVAYYVSGLLFDVYHAVGNAIFYVILAPLLLPLLDKLLIDYGSNQLIE